MTNNQKQETEGVQTVQTLGEGYAEVSTPEGVATADTLDAPISDPTPDETGQIDQSDDAESFPREYVQKLRDESAKYRQRASDRDEIATRLHTALVAATGKLADPSDLAFDDAHLSDPDALTAAIEELVARKPHLGSRRPVGGIGQGATKTSTTPSLAGLLRARA